MSYKFCIVHSEVGVIIGVDMGGTLVDQAVFDFDVSLANASERHPVIVALI